MGTIRARKTKQKNTVTMSFSLDVATKRMIEAMAKSSGTSKSDVVRDKIRYYQWRSGWEDIQKQLRPMAEKHDLHSDEDVYRFLES